MNILFIWVPKTGGTFISKTIPRLKILLDNDCFGFNNAGNVTFGHACPRALLRAGIIAADYWQCALKFAVVRNPYDRFVSLYFDFKNSGRIGRNIDMFAFASAILHNNAKPGLFNVLGLSQCAPQINWILPGVTVYRFEDYFKDRPGTVNAGNHLHYLDYYAQNPGLAEIVAQLYIEDFLLFNYKIH